MENLGQDNEIISQQQASLDTPCKTIKEELYNHDSRSWQSVNGIISDKDVKTECVDFVHDAIEVNKSIRGSTSKCLVVGKTEKSEEYGTHFMLENEVDRMDMKSEVKDVKKEQSDNLDNVVFSDSNTSEDSWQTGDENVELLTRISDNLNKKLSAVCKEEKNTDMDVSQITSPNTLQSYSRSPGVNSDAVSIKVEPDSGSEKTDIFFSDMCYQAFSEPTTLVKHIGRIHHCGYCEQQNKSDTTERIHKDIYYKESKTAVARSSIINYSTPVLSNMKTQTLEAENLNCVISPSNESHFSEQSTGQQVAQDYNVSNLPDVKQFPSIPVCPKSFDKGNEYECSDSENKNINVNVQLSKNIDSREKNDKCNICGMVLADKSALEIHKRIHTGEKPYKCDVCGVIFAHPSVLKRHKRIHTGEKPYKCDVCGVAFAHSSHLKCHSRKHTGEKPYKCDVCGDGFAEANHLKCHKRKHTGEKPYKCDICSLGFAQAGILTRHRRIHTGEKPYKCDVCGTDFAQASSLKYHKRIHTGEKPYKCDVCGVSFARDGHLKQHIRIHTGEKPYKCDVCGVGFAVPSSLKYHRRIHTEEKPYRCDDCGVSFARARGLKCHIKIHTGEKP